LFGSYLFGCALFIDDRASFIRSLLISSRATKHEETLHDAQKGKEPKSKNKKRRTYCRSSFSMACFNLWYRLYQCHL